MAIPVEDPSTTDKKINVTWTPISGVAAGNSVVLAYSLEWDPGNTPAGDWSIIYEGLETNHTVNEVVGGLLYKFRVRARNIYGYGDYSPELSVYPDDKPGVVDIPVVQLSPT